MENHTHINDDMENFTVYDYDPFEAGYMIRRVGHAAYCSVAVICPIIIVFSIVANLLGLVALIRSRMWLRHEGFVYLVAIFASNVGILVFDTSSYWMTWLHFDFYPGNASEFTCKVWHFFKIIFFSSGWLSVSLLFDTYLRQNLTHRRRCGCPSFAKKYCTLFASKVIVGIIFGVLIAFGIIHLVLFTKNVSSNYCRSFSPLVYEVVFSIETCLMVLLPLIIFLPIFLSLILCVSKEGDRFGFSQLEDRSIADEQFRVFAVTLSSMTLFSQLLLCVFIFSFWTVRAAYFVSTISQHIYGLSLGMEPVFCLIIITKYRGEWLSKIPGCKRYLPPDLEMENKTLDLENVQDEQMNAPNEQ